MLRCFACQLSLLIVLILPAAARAAPSCGTGGPTGEGQASAGSGTYWYRIPAGYSANTAIPLLLTLHGDEGKPDFIFSTFKDLQSTSGGAFILVAPKAPAGGGSWYQATSQHTSFIDQVITKILGSYNIDQDRIWITGWSGGATFLGYYAIKRQDILAAVVFHMGGGGGGGYSPPAGSCKIPGRFVIGSADFLYDLAKSQYDTMNANGHAVEWNELAGVGHTFQPSTLPGTWSWLQGKTLCASTTPGSCGPGPDPDSGIPTQGDSLVLPPADSGLPPSANDAGPVGGQDMLIIQRPGSRQDLTGGGCAVASGLSAAPGLSLAPLLLLLGRIRRRRRSNSPQL